MSRKDLNLINYYKELLRKGEVPQDPFDTALERQDELRNLTDTQKNKLRKLWNAKIEELYKADADERARWAAQAQRLLRERSRH